LCELVDARKMYGCNLSFIQNQHISANGCVHREREKEREIFIPSSKETSFDRNHMFTQKQVILPWDVLGLESALGFVASDTG
jgi:hypothetical protein